MIYLGLLKIGIVAPKIPAMPFEQHWILAEVMLFDIGRRSL